jgi:hypothetical protein
MGLSLSLEVTALGFKVAVDFCGCSLCFCPLLWVSCILLCENVMNQLHGNVHYYV